MKNVLLYLLLAVHISFQQLVAQATFSSPTNFPAGGATSSVSIADMNSDDKPDVVCSRVGHVTVFFNTTGSGADTASFSSGASFTTGGTNTHTVFGDLNGDSKPDIVASIFSSFALRVFLNTTDSGASAPALSVPTNFATGSFPYSVDLGDLNGDGTLDMVSTNTGTPNSISVLFNTTAVGASTPTFAAKSDFLTGTGTSPYSVAIGDINGDGKPDIAVANNAASSVSLFINTTTTGAASPSLSASTTLTAGTQPNSVVLGDLNGDGKNDLAVVNAGSHTVSVFLNNTDSGAASPSFRAKTDFATGNSPHNVSMGDINGDGKKDLAVSRNTNPGNITVFLNTTADGDTVPTFAAKTDHPVGTGAVFVSVGDLNADGKQDLAAASNSNLSVFLSTTTQLPVELTSFQASVKQHAVELSWKTATEVNNYGFEVERKTVSGFSFQDSDESSILNHESIWSTIVFIEGNGTTNAPKEYSFTDRNLSAGKYSYRLKQIDRDGKFEYSQRVEVTVGAVPKKFSLAQNYPNPFNPSTQIRFEVPVSGFVALKIYDLLGREVTTLVNEVRNAGSYNVTFDAAGLAGGIYFGKLEANGKQATKKLLLMK